MFRFFAGVVGLSLLAAQGVAAEQPTPAFMQKDVLKAALEIGLTEEQQPKFRDGVTNFMNCRIAAFNRLMKGRDQVDIERKMKSKTKGCAKGMNKAMGEFLTEEQMPKYEHYRETLIDNMKGMG
ncbi:MAG: hypothetical protein FJ194_05415 [Gammaproteobacteria bacterium]|nr:hypothetical protein [Gammaproteobacteria bacterium]